MTRHISLIITALVLLVAYVATLREGHVWGDSAHYIHHAVNVAEGRAYGDTGYLFDPAAPEIGPRNYPPVTALMLAPVVALRGVDYPAFKAVQAACIAVGLLLLALVAAGRTGATGALALLIAAGLNPIFWAQKDHVTSDAPFLLWCFASLAAGSRLLREREGNSWGTAVGCGVLMALAFGTRGVGIVLIPALLLADVFKRRGFPRAGTIVSVLVFAALASAQQALMPEGGDYGKRFFFSLDNVAANAVAYAKYATLPFDGGLGSAATILTAMAVVAPAVIGLVARLRSGPTLLETFAAAYMALILIWPGNQGVRFLLPVIPLLILWCIEGCGSIRRRFGPRPGVACAAVAGLALVVSGGAWYPSAEAAPWPDGVLSEPAREIFTWVDENTGEGSVILFRKPRCMAAFAHRPSSCWKDGASDEELLARGRAVGATHMVSGPFADDIVERFASAHPALVSRRFWNDAFVVYELTSLDESR